MNNWGLTENGFLRPSYNDLLDAFEIRAKELFSSTINLTVRSPLGIFLRIFAWFAGLLWQVAEDIYNSGFIDTAAGISLSRMGAFVGIRPLSASKATGTVTITGEPGAVIFAGLILEAHNNQRFVTLNDVTIGDNGTVDVLIQAYNAGPNGNVAAGAIDTIVTPAAAIISVVNADPTANGRDKETDQAFRERYYQSVDKPGGSNINSIKAAILTVSGVLAVKMFENDTDTVDINGLPSHSISAVVYGGFDDTIAAMIHTYKAAGIQTFGTSSGTVVDASGTIRTIYFSRPTTKTIYVTVRNLVTNDNYPADGNDQLVTAIINCIGSSTGGLVANGLTIGQTVYYNQLLTEIFTVSGVIDLTLAISDDGVTYAANNIIIGGTEKAVTGTENIAISADGGGG